MRCVSWGALVALTGDQSAKAGLLEIMENRDKLRAETGQACTLAKEHAATPFLFVVTCVLAVCLRGGGGAPEAVL